MMRAGPSMKNSNKLAVLEVESASALIELVAFNSKPLRQCQEKVT